MTKKLKKQLKKRIFAVALFASASLLGLFAADKVGLFSAKENSLQAIESSVEDTNYTNVEIIQGTPSASARAASDVITCESLVQGIRDCSLPDGDYTFRVTGKDGTGKLETKDYLVELINFYDDITYSPDAGQETKTISLGDTGTQYKTLAVKYHKNLTIDKGVTVTASRNNDYTYKKGMYLCVLRRFKK